MAVEKTIAIDEPRRGSLTASLDKGVVIDAWARISLVGIELDCDRGPHRGRQRGHLPEVR